MLYINDLPDVFICNNSMFTDYNALYSKCDQKSNLWQQVQVAGESESDLKDTIDWVRKWLGDFNDWKTQLVLLDQCNNTGTTDVKLDESVLKEKSPFKMLTVLIF